MHLSVSKRGVRDDVQVLLFSVFDNKRLCLSQTFDAPCSTAFCNKLRIFQSRFFSYLFVRLCQKAYNMRQDVVIIYVDRRLQNASYYKMGRSPLLQNAAIPITKCADNYKIPKTLLQNTWVITKCVVMTKCRRTLPSHFDSLQFLPGKSLRMFLFKTSLNLQQES